MSFNPADSFVNNPPMHSLSDLAQPYQYQPQPGQPLQQPYQGEQGVVPHQPQPMHSQPSDFDEEMRKKAYETQQALMNRETILKEEYIKAKEAEFARTEELLNERLHVADYIHSQAINNRDDKLRDEMLAKKIALQDELNKFQTQTNYFKEQSELLMKDQPELVNYSPQVEETQPQDHESPTRQQFRKQNTWYDYESNQYNPDLVKSASEIETQMRNEYQLKNMGQYLDTPEYFNDLKGRIFNKYGISQEQSYMAQQPQNPFLPPQMPQLNNNPQPMNSGYQQVPQLNNNPYMQPPQHQPMYQHMPAQGNPNQAYNLGNQMQAPHMQSPNLIGPRMGPPVAPVTNTTMGAPGPGYNMPNQQEMHSQRAFEIFDAALPDNMRRMDHNEKVKFFQTAIKNQGRIR